MLTEIEVFNHAALAHEFDRALGHSLLKRRVELTNFAFCPLSLEAFCCDSPNWVFRSIYDDQQMD